MKYSSFFLLVGCITLVQFLPVMAIFEDEPLTGDLMKVTYTMGIAKIPDDIELQLEIFTADVPDDPAYLAEKEEAAKKNPDDIQVLLDAGKAQLKAKDYTRAMDTFWNVTRQDPTITEGWEGYLLAEWSKLTLFEDVFNHSLTAIEVNPDWIDGYLFAGRAAIQLGDYGKEDWFFEKILEMDPDYAPIIWRNKGWSYHLQDKNDEAVNSMNKALELYPNYTHAWIDLGQIFISMDRKEDALNAYNNALNITPDNPDLLYEKGEFLANSEQYQDSLEIFDQLIHIDPEYRDAWRLRGYVLKKLGDYEEAFNSYKKAVYMDLLDQGYYLSRLEDFVKEMGWKDRMTAVYEDMLQEEEKYIEENLPLDRFEGNLYYNKIRLLYKLGRDVEMKWTVDEANKEIEKFNQNNDQYQLGLIDDYGLASILR